MGHFCPRKQKVTNDGRDLLHSFGGNDSLHRVLALWMVLRIRNAGQNYDKNRKKTYSDSVETDPDDLRRHYGCLLDLDDRSLFHKLKTGVNNVKT